MELRNSLVISRSPVADTIKAERMITPIKHSKLSAISQHFIQTNVAFFVVFLDILTTSTFFLKLLALLIRD
jgi:hypothetical protein